MQNPPRRTLNELEFIYEHHPERQDVFVEGAFDAALVKWFLKGCGLTSAVVYEITTIELPSGEVLASRPRENNRERLVLLSEKISKTGSDHAVCIIDADFSHHTKDLSNQNCLLLTDHACMDGYLFEVDTVEKYLHLICLKPKWDTPKILDSIMNVAKEMFYLRFANEYLNWNMPWPSKKSCLGNDGWNLTFEHEKFRRNWLITNGHHSKVVEFEATRTSLCATAIAPEIRDVNGHDFFEILSWSLKKNGISAKKSSIESVKTGLLLSFDIDQLIHNNLFVAIKKRLETGSIT